MGGLFFFAIILICIALLFFPIYLEANAHYDMNRRKFTFAVYLFKFIRIIGGYAATYAGGIALHVSKRKAILVPYKQLNSERKKFSFVKTFKLKSFLLTTETGAEYLFLCALLQGGLRTAFFIRGGEKEGIENNLWLTDGDVLRVSANCVIYFNLFILLKNFIIFCKEKVKVLCQTKIKKSMH